MPHKMSWKPSPSLAPADPIEASPRLLGNSSPLSRVFLLVFLPCSLPLKTLDFLLLLQLHSLAFFSFFYALGRASSIPVFCIFGSFVCTLDTQQHPFSRGTQGKHPLTLYYHLVWIIGDDALHSYNAFITSNLPPPRPRHIRSRSSCPARTYTKTKVQSRTNSEPQLCSKSRRWYQSIGEGVQEIQRPTSRGIARCYERGEGRSRWRRSR